jgi:aromatic-L-amino-acid decarboxylase
MSSPLEPDRAERQRLSEAIVSYLDEWFEAAGTLEASGIDLDPIQLEELRTPPAETGRPLEEILSELELAGRAGIYHPSGGHMSYIPNAGMYTAALGEFLAAGLNRYTGVTAAAPGFSAIEHGLIDWLTSLFDLGADASGLLLSGGSMANLTGIVTARNAKLGDRFANGVLYVTRHTHHSAAKAARLAGFRSDQISIVDVDDDLRMDVSQLSEVVTADRVAGRDPFLVIASAGTTDTGTIDSLAEIAEVADESDLWMHVDGAYGGFFQLTDRGRSRLAGIERADTLALDPHKGLSIPFGVGALIARDEAALVDAHQGRGAYLRDEDSYMGLRDIASLGPELTRPFRALAVWLPLHLHGVAPFRDALDDSLDLAAHAYERVREVPGVRAHWEPDLSVVAFGFEDDHLGRVAWDNVNRDRTVHLSPTIIEDRFILRLAILNRRSTAEHVDRAVEIIEKTLTG